MDAALPAPMSLVRQITNHKWLDGIVRFMSNGQNPIMVATACPMGDPNVWTYTVELYNSEPKCVTRMNGAIVAAVPISWYTY